MFASHMDSYLFLLKAFAVGLVLAVPVGPMALLCIQRTLHFGFLTGLITGIGIATADSLYGLVGILGLSVVSDFLLQHQTVFRIGGGLFLGFLGMKIFHEAKRMRKAGGLPEHKGYIRALISSFFLTLSNPMTVLAYVAVMAGMQISAADFRHPWVFVAPVFLGSFSWWLFLASMAILLKKRLRDEHMHMVGMISGVLLMLFSVIVIISAL
ncbi:MAG: LysE family transporter [Myxococcota bacterium]